MSLKPNQPRTGHLDEDSPNAEQRGGRNDGFGPNQKTSGHKTEADFPTGPNAEQRRRPWRGSNHGEDIGKGPLPETTRSDTAHEV